MNIKGSVYKLPDNIDTDVIIPARYLNTYDEKELATHCLEDFDENFNSEIKFGDIIAAGENFGCGSSREHAPIAIKSAGISLVIAKSFARIFFRNAINIGLPIITCPDVVCETNAGDTLSVNLEKGEIVNISTGKIYKSEPFPDFLSEIIKNGGLLNSLR